MSEKISLDSSDAVSLFFKEMGASSSLLHDEITKEQRKISTVASILLSLIV